MEIETKTSWSTPLPAKVAEGHQEGSQRLLEASRLLQNLGVKYLTVYALSTENLSKRSDSEIKKLFLIFEHWIEEFLDEALENYTLLQHVGNMHDPRVPDYFRTVLFRAEKRTRLNAGNAPSVPAARRTFARRFASPRARD